MKKIFVAFACLAAMALTSCSKDVMSIDASKLDNTVNKCWNYTLTAKAGIASASEDAFLWGTERECVETLQYAAKAFQIAGIKFTATYKEAPAKTEEACWDLETEKKD